MKRAQELFVSFLYLAFALGILYVADRAQPRALPALVESALAAASQNNATLRLQQLDSSGTPILNRTIGPFQYAGSVGVFTNSILTDTNPHSQTLPTTTVYQLYFKNTGASGTITLTWTPSGGSSNVVKAVGPGGVEMFWETTTGSGITALSLQSSTSSGTYEMFLGG